jgi:hypothetical protein
MTSVSRELQREQDMGELADRVCAEFGRVYGRAPVPVSAARLEEAIEAVPG